MREVINAPSTLLNALATLYPDSSKTSLRQMLESNRVRVNGEIEKQAKRQLERGDVIDVSGKTEQRLLPPTLAILHEDDDVIVVLKAPGLLTVATERE